jgi:uncharacterized membrane protein (DUF485 family)
LGPREGKARATVRQTKECYWPIRQSTAIDADPGFRELHDRKTRFLWSLMAFSVAYYFLLPIGAAYFTDLYRIKVWGPINVGLLFALSQFLVAWGIAFLYARKASQFDAMAAQIARKADSMGGRQ